MREIGRVGRGLAAVVAALGAGLFGLAAMAQDATTDGAPPPKIDTGDTAWMLTSTAIVLLMTIPGVALFYGGMVRKKNVLSVGVQVFAIVCLVTVLWMVVGYSLAFTEGGAIYGGFSRALLIGAGISSLSGTIPESVFATFQLTFAIITVALIVGAFAERMKFSALLLFSGGWLLAVYVPIAHAVWGGGFLMNAGVLDFAGGTVVHINSGVAGLVSAIVIGKRIGFGKEHMPPHNLVLTLIGGSLLWVGWFGFNAGSAVAANGLAGMAMIGTQVATAAAGFSWMLVEWLVKGKPSLLGIVSGAVAGLVAITPASGFVNPWAALLIGLSAGAVCYGAVTGLKGYFGYDDSLDAFGVHGVGGTLGALLTGFLAQSTVNSGGSGAVDGNWHQILLQLYGIAVTVAWSGIVTFALLKIINAMVGIRVDEESEREGLDIRAHGESVA